MPCVAVVRCRRIVGIELCASSNRSTPTWSKVRPASKKGTGRRDDRHGGLLFPPERGEHGLPFELRKRNPAGEEWLAISVEDFAYDISCEVVSSM